MFIESIRDFKSDTSFSSESTLFSSFFMLALLGFSLSFDHQGFVVMNLTTSLVAIISSHSIKHRKAILRVCAYVFFTSVCVLLAMQLSENNLLLTTEYLELAHLQVRV